MSRLRGLNGGYMLQLMTPPNKLWALLAALVLGLWAGGAAAQTDGDGDWFEEQQTSPEPGERPTLKIHGKGEYDPPPPDFRADPPIVKDEGADETTYNEEEVEDPELQQRAVDEFSPKLAPYGYWVDDPYYGRVWVPNRSVVGPDFRPYVTGGRWELTADDEWLWTSDYPFGWVTFHHGRWAWLAGGSWGWVPGYVYAPAWVDFRVGASGYVGWGPAPPYSVWRGGVFVSLGVRRPVPYIFCPTSYVFASSLHRHVIYDRHRVRSIAAQTQRYRPRYVAGSSVRVRSPSVREARIPSRYVPSRRVIAQPRSAYLGTYRQERAGRAAATRRDANSRREIGTRRDTVLRREHGARQDDRRRGARRSAAPPVQYRGAPAGRARDDSRARDDGYSGRKGGPSASPRRAEPPRNVDRGWRSTGAERRDATPSRAAPARAAPARGRDDAPRGRSVLPPAASRRDASVAGGARHGGEARRGGSSSSRGPAQQRSRDARDSRGSR
jgi:hypothetical protein